MIKVICINGDGIYGMLHTNWTYFAETKIDGIYSIYHDEGNKLGVYVGNFSNKRFITLAKWREKQIDSILND